MAGADIVRELPAELALPVWHTLRSVLLWADEPGDTRGGLFRDGAMDVWEAELLTGRLEPALRSPLAVLARALAAAEGASPEAMAWGCVCVTEWATARGATATAVAFAEAAARCWPEHPRYAWMAGRLLRTHGRFREAETWLRHAVRLAVRCGDAETQVLGMNSLGNGFLEQGNNRQAEVLLRQALALARRRRILRLEGEICHDLSAAAAYQGRTAEAEEFARRALEVYVSLSHARLPHLAHDVAYLWLTDGYVERALVVFAELAPLIRGRVERLRLLANTARAVAALGDEARFGRLSAEIDALVVAHGPGEGVACALLDVAGCAADLGDWRRAEDAALRALRVARERGEADVVVRADATLERIAHRPTRPHPPRVKDRSGGARRHPLACGVVASLKDAEPVLEDGRAVIRN